jgi:hypothetical protein
MECLDHKIYMYLQSVVTLRPRNPVSPVVVLSAPSDLGACSDLNIDATGSYGIYTYI